jgi:hypothetical protein
MDWFTWFWFDWFWFGWFAKLLRRFCDGCDPGFCASCLELPFGLLGGNEGAGVPTGDLNNRLIFDVSASFISLQSLFFPFNKLKMPMLYWGFRPAFEGIKRPFLVLLKRKKSNLVISILEPLKH